MKYKLITFITLISCVFACSKTNNQTDFTSYVNTKIGTAEHGHVFVGASLPFGMVQLGPTSIPEKWDWCSGYHDSDSSVIGFSHTHLEGTGIGDLFDITVMPVVGKVNFGRGTVDNIYSGQASYANRTKEVTKPGYYSVPLTRYNVLAELTATTRTGIHRYTFPKSDSSAIIFDMVNGGCWDKTTSADIKIVDNTTISGYRYSTGWAKDQKIYFYAQFSKPFYNNEEKKDSLNNVLFARFNFKTTNNEQIMLRVGISSVSIEGAKLNLEAEATNWDFDAYVKNADKVWNEALGKVKVDSDDNAKKETFYTAMYHSLMLPAIFSDVDKSYRGADGQIYKAVDYDTYTTLSLWDTYRAEMPLLSIIAPERINGIINTMLDIYDHQGKLPVWHLMGNETNCMVGNPGVIVVGDAVVKGFTGFDWHRAFNAMKQSAMLPERGQELRMQYGYIPADKMKESVAYDMEYAIADGAVAAVAAKIDSAKAYQFFKQRSESFARHYDAQSGFMKAVKSDGKFVDNFDPYYSDHRDDPYCEGNAWQYSWLFPQDLNFLTNIGNGNKDLTISRLDKLFEANSNLKGDNVSPDISGMIGQYVHGNEPSHHIIYFYTVLGKPWKAANRIQQVCNTLYSNKKDGLCGNEDAGQMSAWYILSSLGFYQIEPASTRYWFGVPAFKEIEIKVPNGEFKIKAKDLNSTNKYIQSMKLNGKEYKLPYIDYADIIKGGELEIQMGEKETTWYDVK